MPRLLFASTSMLLHCYITDRTSRKSKILHKSQIRKSFYNRIIYVIVHVITYIKKQQEILRHILHKFPAVFITAA